MSDSDARKNVFTGCTMTTDPEAQKDALKITPGAVAAINPGNTQIVVDNPVEQYFTAQAALLAYFGFAPDTPVTLEDFRAYHWRVDYDTDHPQDVDSILIIDDESHREWLNSFGTASRGEQSFYPGESYTLFNFRDWFNENANRVAILDNAKLIIDWEG
jgi:hypothetical protein